MRSRKKETLPSVMETEKPANKAVLLHDLKEDYGAWVSGQLLSERLSLTRSAVWKQVKALKTEGYVIEASPRK